MQVLVVEDDAALGLFLQKGLKLEGHNVTWVGDGEAGLRHAEEHRPDLMVLDLSMPRKDGTEVLEEMRGRFDEMAVLVFDGTKPSRGTSEMLEFRCGRLPVEAVQLPRIDGKMQGLAATTGTIRRSGAAVWRGGVESHGPKGDSRRTDHRADR